jgi:hypothetical protein
MLATANRVDGARQLKERSLLLLFRALAPAYKRVDEGGECSYFVLMESEERKGDRWLRLGDVAPHEVIVVRCPCGRSVEFPLGFLQRRHRLPSDTLSGISEHRRETALD